MHPDFLANDRKEGTVSVRSHSKINDLPFVLLWGYSMMFTYQHHVHIKSIHKFITPLVKLIHYNTNTTILGITNENHVSYLVIHE